jgi:signal transduction histidine kinase
MREQIDELVDAARLQAGMRLDLVRRPTDLVALTSRSVAQVQATTARHVIELNSDVLELVGNWDTLRLERVVENLLGNAVQYSPNGGTVAARISRKEDHGRAWGVLEVRDQGIGIPAADLPRIFERYHRGRNVTGRIAGTGIGLAGAKQIVEQHGGRIQVESVEGDGSRFSVSLPIAS